MMKTPTLITAVVMGASLLAACSDNDSMHTHNQSVDVSFQVKVANLTHGQPFSPIAAVAHQDGWQAFREGSAASDALEVLAEGGDNTDLILDAEAAMQYQAHATASGALAPKTESSELMLSLTTNELDSLQLSLVTMLVNTNDGFTGVNAVTIGDLQVGESRTYYAPVWDAGTELNTEATGTIPGPADGGTGYDSARENLNVVRIHAGVISTDDGLASSVLNQAHRFDNPAARITVTRSQ